MTRLEQIVKEASSVWSEQTEGDRRVLETVQKGTLSECVRFLTERGHFDAAEELDRMAKT